MAASASRLRRSRRSPSRQSPTCWRASVPPSYSDHGVTVVAIST